MHIKLIGTNDGSQEYEAGKKLKEIFESGLSNIKGKVFIKPNLKVTGPNKQQLDLIVWGEFDGGYQTPYSLLVKPKDPRSNFNPIDSAIPRKVIFKNFFLVIEEKSHSYSGIRTIGNELEVLYIKHGMNEWHNASRQSADQTYTVKAGFNDFIRRQSSNGNKCPFVLNLIWLTGVNFEQTKGLNIYNILPANFDVKLFLQTIAACHPPIGEELPSPKAGISNKRALKVIASLSHNSKVSGR